MIKNTLIYVERDGKYLMLHRVKKQGDVNKDKWIGVGGKLEEGETPEMCARREMLEETGLTARALAYRGIVNFYNTVCPHEEMHLFTCADFTGEVIECDEGVLEWVDKNDIEKLNIWEGDRIFLRLLNENRPFFILTLNYEGDRLISHELIYA